MPPVSRSKDSNISFHDARTAGLHHTSDDSPGFRRSRFGKNFRYFDISGEAITDEAILERIRLLVIPPAWTEVWISPRANGHLQATGRDARGRKQYRYHAKWRSYRDTTKYDRMVAFAKSLPRMRARIKADIALSGLPRPKVLATVVHLLATTLIRVGNEEYVRANGSYGLTTFYNRHAKVQGSTVHFAFRGKSGIFHRIDVRDRRLARIVRGCRDLPGHELFQYLDEEGTHRPINSADVNEYLHEVAGHDFTAKDFRTWGATVMAMEALAEVAPYPSKAEAKRRVVAAIKSVAKRLGNTAAVCRKSYIHPAIIDGYLEGSLPNAQRIFTERKANAMSDGLVPIEKRVLRFLQGKQR